MPRWLYVALSLALASGACAASQAGDLERAAMLADKGQAREAAAVLREHLAKHPRDVPERRMLVRVLASTGDLGAARREAERLAADLGAASPIPWIELGHAFELGHRYDEALAAYDRAAEVAPKDAAGPRAGGMRAARWGETEIAAPRLEEALRRDPRDAEVWHALGLVRTALGDLDGARIAYASGLAADPKALENRLGLATLALRRDDPKTALAEYDAIVKARPGFVEARLGRSLALLMLGRLDEADAALADAEAAGADRGSISAQRKLLARQRSKRP